MTDTIPYELLIQQVNELEKENEELKKVNKEMERVIINSVDELIELPVAQNFLINQTLELLKEYGSKEELEKQLKEHLK